MTTDTAETTTAAGPAPSADVQMITRLAFPQTNAQMIVAPPAIGGRWPGVDGIYAGVSRGVDGQPDAHLVLLDVKVADVLPWAAAMAWAESQGDGAHLPTRDESALLYAHLRDQCTGGWHWTSTQYDESYAWSQDFSFGSQYYGGKKYEGRARAVRRFPL